MMAATVTLGFQRKSMVEIITAICVKSLVNQCQSASLRMGLKFKHNAVG
jgi:hypothetical protein